MHPLFTSILEGRSPGLDAFVEVLGGRLPLLHALASTPQDDEWHGEGDVYTHTGMVLEEVWALLREGRAQLSPRRRLALALGAALHDIGKPLTTCVQVIKGQERVVAPRHDDRGRSYVAGRLVGLGLPPEVVRDVMALIGHHHDPKRLVKKEAPAGAWRKLGRLVDPELVWLLELADMRGRICPDRQEQIEQIELYRLGAEEHGAFGPGDPWGEWRAILRAALADEPPAVRDAVIAECIRQGEASEVHSAEEALARSWAWRQGAGQLFVLCGPSGVGKSTWLSRNISECSVIALDAIRAEVGGDPTDQSQNGRVLQLARERLKGLLRSGRPVVWDATNLRRDGRASIIRVGLAYRAVVTVVALHAPLDVLRRRNLERARTVPSNIQERQFDAWQWPTADEAHHLLVVDVTDEARGGEVMHAARVGGI